MNDDWTSLLIAKLKRPADDPLIVRLLALLEDLATGRLTDIQAQTELEHDPAFAPARSLISFQNASITGGVTLGDIAGGNIVKIAINLPTLPPRIPALHQLRAPVPDFVGRTGEIDRLVQTIDQALAGGAAVAISGIRGLGGVGKTELAYVVAQRLTPRFPDAQLLLDLRGATSAPMSSALALQTVIRALAPEPQPSDDLDALQALYRSLLHEKQVLILADDAHDAAQVRPLLPPSGCALLITSRQRFTLPGMAALDLGMLTPDEAQQLLLTICPRIGEGAARLAQLCGYLPLALRVSASLLVNNATRNVDRYLVALADERARLVHLRDPDDSTLDVEASLALSYKALKPAAKKLLSQLSVFPASFDLPAALAVVELPARKQIAPEATHAQVEELLGVLYQRSLLDYDGALERYSLHDLVRTFAAAHLGDAPSLSLRHARHYAQLAALADDLFLQGGDQVGAGLALFDQERAHIDAGWMWTRAQPPDAAIDELLIDYARATAYIGDLRYHARRERIPQLETALAAARRQERKRAEGVLLGNLGLAYADLGEARQAIEFYEQDLTIVREIGDRRGEGAALGNLGNAYAALGERRRAIEFYQQSLTIAREIGDRRAEGNTLGNLGSAYYRLGEVRHAIEFYQQWLIIAREIGDRHAEGQALGGLGLAYADLGEPRQAIEFYQQWLIIAREIGDRRGEGAALGNLGNAYAALREPRQAIEFYQQHLAIAREIGDQHGEGAALGNLGIAYKDLGEAQRAIEFYQQHLAIAREIGDRHGEALTSWNLGEQLERQGDLAAAAAYMQILIDFEREIGHSDAEQHAAQLDQVRQRLQAEQNAGTSSEAGDTSPVDTAQ